MRCGRREITATVSLDQLRSAAARVNRRKPRKRVLAQPPPRNGNAKGGIDQQLLRKIILEFNHMDVYGKPSEHFDDVRREMGALL